MDPINPHPHQHEFDAFPDFQLLQPPPPPSNSPEQSISNTTAEGGASGAGENRVQKRQRGRPTGSKNKPKPPVVKHRDNTLKSHVIQIDAASDIIDCITTFAHRRQVGVCILSATGTVGDLTLRHPDGGANIILLGRFNIVSLSGYFLPPPAPPSASGMAVYISDRQGRIFGGRVVGPLLAAEPVVIVVASFGNISYERLPIEEELRGQPPPMGGGGVDGGVPLNMVLPEAAFLGYNTGDCRGGY